MSRLYQIKLVDGSIFVVREEDSQAFFKEKIYKIKKGCAAINMRMQNGQLSIQLFDLAENPFCGLPILIQTHHIVKVELVKQSGELEALYLKVTSGLIVTRETLNIN